MFCLSSARAARLLRLLARLRLPHGCFAHWCVFAVYIDYSDYSIYIYMQFLVYWSYCAAVLLTGFRTAVWHTGASALVYWRIFAYHAAVVLHYKRVFAYCTAILLTGACLLAARLFWLLARLRCTCRHLTSWRVVACPAVVLLTGASSPTAQLFCFLVRIRLPCGCFACCRVFACCADVLLARLH